MEATEHLLQNALGAARDTRFLAVDPGVRRQTAAVFEKLFGTRRAVIVADQGTFAAAGADVQDSLLSQRHDTANPFVFEHVHAEHTFVEQLTSALQGEDAIPVAVGSGTINDLTKLAAHRLQRPYMVVATAASMDGYTAYGASITYQGSKQTFDCPAPVAVLADLDVIAGAPDGMNASGYADLLAKCAAGADWILADGAGIEAIDPRSWDTVQKFLRSWVSSPAGVRRRDPESLRNLVNGLMMGGFAMQALKSSRPASGAEHQFSHLWDMQNHTHNGMAPSHGFKVGIGTLASIGLYEALLDLDADSLSVGEALDRWPSLAEIEARIAEVLGSGELAEIGRREMREKYIDRDELARKLPQIREAWPTLKGRLRSHLLSFTEARDMLAEAGCPTEPAQIGIDRDRLRRSYSQAYFIRRRFTVLDFAAMWRLSGPLVDGLFGPSGCWSPALATIRSMRR
jgi:glycerol-1-phosphate dehydrogenase [NAD(P)+]